MNSAQPPRFRSLSRSGFSLIEVVLAVAIMALGVVTILGLLPHGLEVSRKTANELAEGRIVDSIVGDLQAMNWETLHTTNYGTDGLYFDDQGLVLSKADAVSLQSYVAKVEIPPLDVILPTNEPVPQINRNLRRVVIEVASSPLTDFFSMTPRPAGVTVRKYTHLIANVR